MTNDQFLTTFKHHLNVGGPQREEIIAEMESHLNEQSSEKLGDPKKLAQKSNRVHLGFFSSPKRILATLLILVILFDVVIPWLGVYIGWGIAGSKHFINIPAIWTLTEITTYISTAAFAYLSFHVVRMRSRWRIFATLVSIMLSGYVLSIFVGTIIRYYQLSGTSSDTASAWDTISSILSYLAILYVSLGMAAFFISTGKQMLFPKHRWLDALVAFAVMTLSAYYVLPFFWNVVTEFHYTEYMYYASIPYFDHKTIISIGFGFLGVLAEIFRLRSLPANSITNK